jgi:hypothetical protein
LDDPPNAEFALFSKEEQHTKPERENKAIKKEQTSSKNAFETHQ